MHVQGSERVVFEEVVSHEAVLKVSGAHVVLCKVLSSVAYVRVFLVSLQVSSNIFELPMRGLTMLA